MTVDGWQPLIVDYLQGKNTYDGRHPQMKDNVLWMKNFKRRNCQ